LLIYAATVDLLAEDFLSDEGQRLMDKKQRIWGFTFVMMGGMYSDNHIVFFGYLIFFSAAGMSVVGAFA
jgi:solute carrier family 39 (zinc transporter), member 1/2/3